MNARPLRAYRLPEIFFFSRTLIAGFRTDGNRTLLSTIWWEMHVFSGKVVWDEHWHAAAAHHTWAVQDALIKSRTLSSSLRDRNIWNRPWNDCWHVLKGNGRPYKTMSVSVPAVEFHAELVSSMAVLCYS